MPMENVNTLCAQLKMKAYENFVRIKETSCDIHINQVDIHINQVHIHINQVDIQINQVYSQIQSQQRFKTMFHQ